MRVLVVEDDDMLREAVVAVLQEEFYVVEEAGTGSEGLYKALQGIYDLVVLDIMLPEMSGLVIVKKIRAKGNSIPILLLTARDTVEDRVAGLEAGADDYLIKPFAVPELLARVKALLRRSGSVGHEGELAYGNIIIQAKSKDAFINEAPLHLTVKEYELLEFLIINREQILTREQIYDRIWGLESDTTISIVDLYIHYLRKKLAPYGQETLIQTIRGAGFILKEN
jgi:DNA-binding response OmpR family regulator